ncbi:MAG TPA: ABC transporter ATP-binding protein [Dehalococcoidia bacterium]|jgi:branched-chain amino acid transport system ATP-binding protein
MLEVKNLNVSYGVTPILRDVSLSVKQGEVIALLGSNGAGKTTLVNALMGMLKAESGEIIFEGEHIENMQPHEIVKRGIAQVPEGRKIFPYISVRDNLYLGAYSNEAWHKRSQSMEWVYGLFPLLKERQNMPARTLSGGEQQMLVIGRGLMSRPKLMLVDEPSLGLAPKLLSEVYEILDKLSEEKITTLLSEQNARQALTISDRGYVLENGKVVLADSSKKLLNSELIKEAYLGR